MVASLDQLLADWKERANQLRYTNHSHDATLIEKVCDEVADCMVDFLTWMSEERATLYTGLKAPALRHKFPSLEARGLAKWDEQRRRRLYRRVGLEHRGNSEAAREEGRRAGAA